MIILGAVDYSRFTAPFDFSLKEIKTFKVIGKCNQTNIEITNEEQNKHLYNCLIFHIHWDITFHHWS